MRARTGVYTRRRPGPIEPGEGVRARVPGEERPFFPRLTGNCLPPLVQALFLRRGGEVRSPCRPFRWDRDARLARVRTLSGGEQVLCALATAVVAKPTLLVLDEWDSHLDWETAARVEACIRKMHLPHVVWCTQDMDIAASADGVVFLDRGRVRYAGAPQAVFPSLVGTCWYPPSWSLEEWNSSSIGST